ncbi:MAG TPA: hydrogenase formation protein HypD [Candidatus Aminicenantes bacterium]|nr:hydrogenase formation protein HypD [Candidatus Aminicenantes bacterium]
MAETKLKRLAAALRAFPARPGTQFMEVCGTHTVAIRRAGIHKLLPDGVKLVSGPGCPVCVSPDRLIDEAAALARQGVVITSFGDMLRVPGSRTSLDRERAAGADVRAVYSPLDALAVAAATGKETVFLAVGFETTAPAIAAAALKARERKIANFSLLTALRLVPPALKALISSNIELAGFLLPGHVSAIIGKPAYEFLAARGLPGVIAGFDPEAILTSLLLLLEMHEKGVRRIVNNYPGVVRDEGNERSRAVLAEVFAPADAEWRGLGVIPRSGLELRPAYAGLDARRRFRIVTEEAPPRRGCRCGDVLRGRIDPPACPLFNKACRPDSPVGPCMVSAEGSCSAWVLYE